MTANFFYRHTATGEDLYLVQRELLPSSRHLDTATAEMVAFDPLDWEDYTQEFTEGPDYFYGLTHPIISQGRYVYDIFKQLGASKAITDTLLTTIIGYWNGSQVYADMPITVGGRLEADLQSVLTNQLNSIGDFKAPAQPIFQVLPSIQHGATSIILRIPVTRKDGEPSGGGLTHESTGLFIAVKPNNTATPTYMYSVFDGEIEPITTIGTYEAPTAGKARFGFATPAGMYELHLGNDIFSHTGATNLTVTISGHVDHATTICEVPLAAAVLGFNFYTLPEILHGSTNNILRVPVDALDLTHESAGLNIVVRPNNSDLPVYEYETVNIETVTVPGTYQAPSEGKVRFAAVAPPGMYELHFGNAVYSHLNATNLTVVVSVPNHDVTICEVPLVNYNAQTLSNQINLLPEASTTRAFANPVFDYDLTTGTYISGTIENTQSTLDPDLVFSPSATDPLVVEVQFICIDGMADTLEITGRTTGTGGTEASREVSVWAYNIAATAWTELSTGGTRIPVSAINAVRDYQIQPQHQDQTTGVVRVQFRSQRVNADDRLYLDRMDITVLRAGVSVAQIVQGVHYTKIDPSIMRNGSHDLPAWFWWQIRPLVISIDSVVGNDITCSGARFDAAADYVGHTIQFHFDAAYRFARVTAQAGAVLTVDDIQDVDDTWHGYILTNRVPNIGEISGLTDAQAQMLKDILALSLI